MRIHFYSSKILDINVQIHFRILNLGNSQSYDQKFQFN